MNSAFFDFEKITPFLLWLLAILCFTSPKALAQPAGFTDELVIDGWSQAVGVTFDKNGRMYVWEKGGKVWTVENGVKAAEPLIDLTEEVGNWRDFGLVGFALDPNFLNNGHIYLWYVVDRHHLLNYGTNTYNPNASSEKEATIARLTRYTANRADNFSSINYNSRKILIGESKATGPPILHESHGAGQIIFGTDGTLMVTVGDGASYANPVDEGSHPATYYQQALDDGIITPAQNIGAYRCQSLNNLSGKILRIDPETGNGVPSNPYYQAINPRSPQSRTWSIGIRNPYRIALKPETGSHNAVDGNPGTFFFGDVGWSTWEDLNVVEKAGQNFGWPIYEGINQKAGYNNPNYAVGEAEHARPKVDWRHGADQARAYVNGQITSIGNGIVAGKQFRGNSSTGGVWYTGSDFPEAYQNTYFHADYSSGWIRNFGFDAANNPTFVKDFKLNAGAVVFLNTSPVENGLFYVRYPNQIRKISYIGNTNKKPIAIVQTDKNYGVSPLTVKFDASQSFDPEFSPLTFLWNFGDNASSTAPNPTVVFEAPSSAPATYPVTLQVKDALGAISEKIIPISLNNTPPVIVSTSIDNQRLFSARNGANLNLNAVVTDKEHNGQLKYEWQTALFHNGHSHAEPIDNNPSTTTSLSPIECDGSTYWFRVTLKVTDPEGLFTTFQKDIFPDCVGLPQTINCAPIPDQSITAGDVVLNVTATSGLPVSNYLLEGPAVIFGNKIVPTGFPGKVTIRATQGGNEVYQPAEPIERSFNIVLPSNATCTAEGLITRDIWNGGGRNSLNDIPVNTSPNESSTLSNFEVQPFTSADNAQRIRGFICPPQTGIYTFWIASDEDSQLWLSTNANQKNKRLIANIRGSSRANQWNKYASQQSEGIFLVAGSQYYIEGLMSGGGHMSAGWKMPDNALDRPISGQYLSTFKGKQDQVITFFGIPDKLTTDPAFTVGATANSGLGVDFSIVFGPATVSGNTVTLTGVEGVVNIRATQSGNDQFNAAQSVERRFEVVAPPTVPAVVINSPTNGSSFTENTIAIKYTLSGNLAFHNANHLLVSLDNQTPIDVHTLNGIYTLNNLSEGVHTVKIQIADGNHRPFANTEATAITSFSIIPSEKEQTIKFFPIADKLTTDIPFTISASATSGLPVSLRIQSGPATMNGNTITLNGTAGTVVIRASQTGNEAYRPAADVTQSFTVSAPATEKLNQTISFPAISNKNTTDRPFEVNAVASSGLPVTLSIESGPARVNGKVVTLEGKTGTVIIRASQAGNAQYKRAISFGRSFTVTEKIKQNQTISFSVIPNKFTDDAPFRVNASSSSGLPVTFNVINGPAAIVGNQIILNGTAGTVIIRASQGGNEDFNNAPNFDRSFIVTKKEVVSEPEKINQLISFSSIADKLTTDVPFAIGATTSSGLPVNFSVVSGPATISGNTVSLTGALGTVLIRASQGGNEQYFAAPNVDRPFEVTAPVFEKQEQVITFNPITNKLTTAQPFSIIATSSSNLPVQLSVIAGPATISGNTITLNGTAGTVVIQASQAGNSEYFPATNMNRSFKVEEPIEDSNNEPASDYCNLSSNFPWQEWIGQVTFGDLNNTTSKDIYKLFENPTTSVEIGQIYPLTVVPVFSWTQRNQYINVWIDFNQDKDFDDVGENVVSEVSLGGLPQQAVDKVIADVLIPANATEGKTRMRIAMQRGNFPPNCGKVNQGEVEDYIITIKNSNSPQTPIPKQNQQINFPVIPNQLTTAAPFILNATSSANLTVSYDILAGPATVNGKTISLTGTEGTVVVSAKQAGNSQYYPAQSINRAFKVNQPASSEPADNPPSTNTSYCDAKGNAPWQEWIEKVSFGTINHHSSKDGYANFTNISSDLNKETSYSISISPGFSWTQWNEHINVWIDFNQNGSFEDVGEQVLSGISLAGTAQSIPQTVSGTVTIPASAKIGKTRMRVTMQQAQYADACGNFEYGEVEDYGINILASSSNRTAQILTFSAYPDDQQTVELEWISNGDALASHYQIERSEDNLKFYPIAKQYPDGITFEPNFYFSADKSPLKGVSYYRIKQVNQNGSFKYSNAVIVERAYGTEEFYLFPNPVKNIINLHLKPFLGKSAHLKIYNSLGRLVKESKLENIQTPTLRFSMENEQNGMYYLYIKSDGQKEIGRKFILSRNY